VLQFRVGAVAPATLASFKASGRPCRPCTPPSSRPPEPAIRSATNPDVKAVFELMSK
jgi:hypothetical protein